MNHEEFTLAVAEHHKEQGWAQSLGFLSASDYHAAADELFETEMAQFDDFAYGNTE